MTSLVYQNVAVVLYPSQGLVHGIITRYNFLIMGKGSGNPNLGCKKQRTPWESLIFINLCDNITFEIYILLNHYFFFSMLSI